MKQFHLQHGGYSLSTACSEQVYAVPWSVCSSNGRAALGVWKAMVLSDQPKDRKPPPKNLPSLAYCTCWGCLGLEGQFRQTLQCLGLLSPNPGLSAFTAPVPEHQQFVLEKFLHLRGPKHTIFFLTRYFTNRGWVKKVGWKGLSCPKDNAARTWANKFTIQLAKMKHLYKRD